MSSPNSLRPDKPVYYVVREAWVVDGASGKEVFIEANGVRADGSFWVTSANISIPLSQWSIMTEDDIIELIRQKILENERVLDEAWAKTVENEQMTSDLKKDVKISRILGYRIDIASEGTVK